MGNRAPKILQILKFVNSFVGEVEGCLRLLRFDHLAQVWKVFLFLSCDSSPRYTDIYVRFQCCLEEPLAVWKDLEGLELFLAVGWAEGLQPR